jgi:hypothetical protein
MLMPLVSDSRIAGTRRRRDRGGGVHRQIGRDLDRDIAVLAIEAIIDWAQRIAGVLDVLDRQAFVSGLDGRVGLRQIGLELIVIGIGMTDRLFEDRRVGGDAGQPVLRDQLLQPALVHELAIDEIQPDRLPDGLELLQTAHRIPLFGANGVDLVGHDAIPPSPRAPP